MFCDGVFALFFFKKYHRLAQNMDELNPGSTSQHWLPKLLPLVELLLT